MKHTTVGASKTLLDLSISAVGAWCDRFYSYRLPHAIGLLYCGAQVTSTVQLIHEACPITTNFKNFEDSLCSRPNCGSSTPLYDAIDLALKMMNQFYEQYKDKISTNYQKLIICVSDGEDTCSKMTLPIIASKLQQEKVIFDSICFSGRQAASLVRLCQSTKGYYYFPIPHLDQDLITLFERETAMVVRNRAENVYGVIETPKISRPTALHSPAMNLQKAAIKDVAISHRSGKRILQEANSLKQNPPENVEVFVGQDNVLFWKIILTGPTGTLYSGYKWLLSVEFPNDYPFKRPGVRFVTPIYHCNISDDGKICLEILENQWNPSTTIYDVLQQILGLLREPDPNNALSAAKGDLYKTAREVHDRELKLHTEKYAKKSIDELKNQYKLEGSDV
jgi:ubiquitin-conjugating enzyme E2 D/E